MPDTRLAEPPAMCRDRAPPPPRQILQRRDIEIEDLVAEHRLAGGPYLHYSGWRWATMPPVLWVTLHAPPAADERDRMAVRIINLSDALGYGGADILPLYPVRKSDVRNFVQRMEDPHSLAERSELEAVHRAVMDVLKPLHTRHTVIAAYGNGPLSSYAKAIIGAIADRFPSIFALGTTRNGHPLAPAAPRRSDALAVFSLTAMQARCRLRGKPQSMGRQ